LLGNSITGTSNEVTIVSRIAEGEKSFSDLWQQYKAATSSEYRRMMLSILVSRSNGEMSSEIEQELCSRFEASPDPDIALLLGMCTSARSLDLLASHQTTTNQTLGKAVCLALARRGDEMAENAFINEFLRQPVGRGELVEWATDQASIESVRHLEYIGRPRCILVLFDAAISMQGKETNTVSTAVVSASRMIANMRDFLARIGVSMPEHPSKYEITEWWRDNRAKVSECLNEKGDDLPRLKPIRIVISQH